MATNFAVLHEANKTASFGSVVFSVWLSMVPPIHSLPSSKTQKRHEMRNYFWLALTKKCLLLLILFLLNILYR
jgi:hypothetical protein